MKIFENPCVKKFLAVFLSIGVLLTGSMSLIANSYAAERASVSISQDGKIINVNKNGNTVLSVNKIDDFNAKLSHTNSKGKTEYVKITVTPIPGNKYKVDSIDESNGNKFEAIGNINPLDSNFNHASPNISSVSPNVLIKFLIDGTTPGYGDLVALFGATVASQVVNNWQALVAAFSAGGFWAVVALLADWPIVGAALAITLAY